LVVLIVIGWQVSLAIDTGNAKHQGVINNIQAHNYRNGYDYQQTLRASVTSDLTGIMAFPAEMVGQSAAERQVLGSQRVYQVSQFCSDANDIMGDPLPAQQAAFVSANCTAGTISPTSVYEIQPTTPNP
jgi:hypothetical protein